MAAMETLPAVETVPLVEGEVIDPQQRLKVEEQNIKRNFKKFEAVQQSVARSLNVIYYNDLWKLHKTAEGKRRYTNFNDYLVAEFGWDKTAARARQIMKQDIPAAIEAGEIPAEVGDKRRERTAPQITAARAAKVTVKQLEKALDAWDTRMENVDSGDDLAALVEIHVAATSAIESVIESLNALIERAEAEAEFAGNESESDDDDTDEDES